jgi:7-carboxy-7-deazaguanine synthase (Cx14CxxC type)
LWSGKEEDRAKAICQFCDTDFVGVDGPGGGYFADSTELALRIAETWTATAGSRSKPFVVFTGGEPALQLDAALLDQVHAAGFEAAIETNGTRLLPPGLDWVCVSPKAGAPLRLRRGHELKLIYPQAGAPPEAFADLDFLHFFLQPMDGPQVKENMRLTVDYCLRHPQWRVSLQTHKVLGIA